ncbi:uncharacterized protein LOC144907689 [Branchiostoma floridae x Branchiostoma belcheri]
MGKGICLLSLALLLVWSKEINGQTTVGDTPTSTEDPRPCGDFPWDSEDVTADCDYSYRDERSGDDLVMRGRCTVTCHREADMLVGPPYVPDVLQVQDGAYYCNMHNRTWLGTEPRCLDRFNGTTMVTDETNGIRLVGGEFYGCVELFDDVTQQWGPVRGWSKWNWEIFVHRMSWADLVCKNLGFPSGLATVAYLLTSGTHVEYLQDFTSQYDTYDAWNELSYQYPATAPKFIMSEQLPTADNATLHDAIARVVRGPCPHGDYNCREEGKTMCLACAGQQKQEDSPVSDDASKVHAVNMVSLFMGACAVVVAAMLNG